MGRPFMGNRVAAVVVCGLLVGVIGAALAAASAIQHAAGAPSSAQSGSTAQRASSDATSTPSSSSSSTSSSASSTPSPTDTPEPQPTATRAPTSTPTNGLVDLHGTITNLDTTAGTFVLNQVAGPAVTVITNGQTQFQGKSLTLNGLQNGWSAEVKGTFQSAQTFLAVLVNSDD